MKRKNKKKDERKEEKKTESHCVKKWKHNFPFASAVPIFHKGIFPSSLLYHTTKKLADFNDGVYVYRHILQRYWYIYT